MARAYALDPGKILTQYAHRIWGQEEGLFQPTIYSILQTHDGFLWLGTQDSLIRFDGIHFREFDHSQSAGLQRALVRTLLEDQNHHLWTGSIGNGVADITPDGTIQRFTTKNGLPSDDVFCLEKDAGNEFWACTNKGLAQFSQGAFHVFGVNNGLPSNLIRDTCLSTDGTRWVAGFDFGLAYTKTGQYRLYSDGLISSKESVTALHCDEDGSTWVGTMAGLVHIQVGISKSITTNDGLPDDAVSALMAGRDGSLWIGTNDGISRYRHGEISSYTTGDGLSHSTVLSLYEDREGTVWAGTKNGLNQFTDSKVTPYTTTEGLSGKDAGPVLEDGEGKLWIGTLGSGLNVFDGRRFRAITERNGLLDNNVLSLQLDNTGDLWVGTHKGLNRLRHGQIINTYTPRQGLSGSEVRSLFSDVNGTLWVGTDKGLDRFTGARFQSSRILPPQDKTGILTLAGGRTASLFVSTEDSRFFVVRNGVTTSYPTDTTRSVDCYLVDPVLHETWMGTLGSGLLRWRGGVFTHVRVKDGIYDNRIYGIVKDDRANLWLASSKGIFRVSQKELDDFADGKISYVNSIPFSTGQLHFECQSGVQPAATRTRDGRLWFSTTNGLVVIDPQRLNSNRIPPPVQITAIVVNGQKVETKKTGLVLSPMERNIEIRYTGLSFISPEKVGFQYKLEGFDKSWTDAAIRREAFFTNLPPGEFQFKVRARNADGVWSTQSASVNFEVEPKFYQRLWFFPALSVVLGLLVAALYRARLRRLSRTFNLVLSERSRIARELHDTLLQGLSGITMQLQALWTRLPASKEKMILAEIITDASRTSQEARRSLWGLRNLSSHAIPFSDKLADVARQSVKEQQASLVLCLQTINLCSLPEVEYQLLRIVGEVLSNANAHAQAKEIRVELAVVSGKLRLTIVDDGVGFSHEQQPFGHFGLIGIRERADEIEADLLINSSPGFGTTVMIIVALSGSHSPEDTTPITLAHHRE